MSDKRKVYAVLRPIGFSGRREVGEELLLTQEEATNIGSEYVALVQGGSAEKTARRTLESYNEKELKAIAKIRSVTVPARGKGKIIAALRAAK